MKTDTDIAKLEQLFRAISVKNPKESALKKLREYPERDHCIQFLIAKQRAFLQNAKSGDEWDVALEDGSIHACRVLGALKAEAAIDILISLLDDVKHDVSLIMFSAATRALTDIGPPVLEPVYAKYEEDQKNPNYASIWLDILSQIGVRDPRIATALHRAFPHDTVLTLFSIGSYGDREFLPLVDRFVRNAAQYLNECKIDPRAFGARFDDSVAGDYIESREVLVRLRDDIEFEHPDFDRRVEALDEELLTTSEPSGIDFPDEREPYVRPAPKVGRNDPCPCGSGKKHKKCCGQA